MFQRVFLLFVFWRILLFIPLLVAHYFLPFRAGYPYASPNYFLSGQSNPISHYLLSSFGNFDGVYYLLIAAQGYTVNAGFFPLFPILINLSTRIFEQNILPFDPRQYTTATLLVNIFFFFSLIIMYKLVRLDYKKNIAVWSIIFLLIFPTSFFFASIYSEGLFLLLSLLSFYFARKKMWAASGLAGALLSATRLVGLAVWPALLYEYLKAEKNKISIKILPLFLVPLGLLSFIIYNAYKWGNPLYFIAAQGNFQNNRSVNWIITPPQTLFRYVKILTSLKPTIYEWWVAFFELSFFILVLTLLYIAWKKKVRISYLIFGALCFFIPAFSGTFSGLPRYVLIIFPVFLALALIKIRILKIIYCALSTILLFLFFMLFSKGYFIS